MAVGQCDDLFANLDVEINLFGFAKYAVFGIYDWSLLTSERDVKVTFRDSDNWTTFRKNYCLERNKLHEVYVDSTSTDNKPDGQVTSEINGHVMFSDQLINDRFQSTLIYADREKCGTGWTKVRLVLKFGDNPETITWDLKENGDGLFSSSATYEASRNEYTDIFYRNTLVADKCVSGGNYEFQIRSSTSRGLGSGYYKIYTDGKEIASGSGNFGRSSTKTFSVEESPTTGFCFSGVSTVEVQNKGQVPMTNLVLGDIVQVGKNQYEPIYSFGHKNGMKSAEFLQIKTKGSRAPLEISSNHMIAVEDGRYIPASLVKEGDTLISGQQQLAVVTKITKVIRQGAFAPFTPSGRIVVDDIVASNYISYHGSEYFKVGRFETPITNQWMAHTFNSVHRLAIQLGFAGETYTPEGVSNWVNLPHQLTVWSLQRHIMVSTTFIGLALAVVSLSQVIEIVIAGSKGFGVIVGIVVILTLIYRRHSMKKLVGN